jgi:hypothetical protein
LSDRAQSEHGATILADVYAPARCAWATCLSGLYGSALDGRDKEQLTVFWS